MDPTPTPTENDGDFPPLGANHVSVVSTLCGTEACNSNTWNNFRLIDRTSISDDGSDASDLGPLYRPQTTSNEEYVDEAAVHDKHTNRVALPIAVAIPVAAVIAFIVLFSVYRRRRRRTQEKHGNDDGERGPYGLLDSGEPSPAASETFQYNHQPIAQRLDSHLTTASNRTSLFTATTPPPPLPYRRSTHMRHIDAPRPRPRSFDAPAAQAAEPEPPLSPLPIPQPEAQRIRANTFSDVSADDLPPYIDPIEEAMATSRPASLQERRHSRATMQSPPPYDTLTLPERAQLD
ncbi:hypothetical protein IWW50_002645 [Coemansia erecta]|nr:hypothetical protein GGF43_002000 [Coemansia sp. RSA 2618]KAJ2825873.1 hypothetical protein IWW50_002645 [Coemansia erecta]